MSKKTQVALLLTPLTLQAEAMENITPTETEKFKGCNHQHKYFKFMGNNYAISKVLLNEDALKDIDEPINLSLVLQSKPGKKVMIDEQALSWLNDERVNLEVLCKEFILRKRQKHKRLPKIHRYTVMFTKNCQNMCLGSTALTHLDLSGARRGKKCINRRCVKYTKKRPFRHPNSMRGMFSGCNNLKRVDFGKMFGTRQITNMDRMFYDCTKLEELNLSRFDTSKVRTMREMFANCEKLKHLDINTFDTSKVQNMELMFLGCKSLKNIDLSNLKTDSLQSAWKMFKDCESLSSIELGDEELNTGSLKNISKMFENCKSLKRLDLSNLNSSYVKYMGDFINYCSNLHSIKYHPEAKQKMKIAQSRCKGLKSLKSHVKCSSSDEEKSESGQNASEEI